MKIVASFVYFRRTSEKNREFIIQGSPIPLVDFGVRVILTNGIDTVGQK